MTPKAADAYVHRYRRSAMKLSNCLFERPSNVSVGVILLLTGLAFAVSGITVLPIIGFVIALPILGLAGIFLAARRSKECAL